MVRAMTMDDYDDVYALWMSIHGFGIRSIDDSREGIERFIKRNPGLSAVDIEDGRGYISNNGSDWESVEDVASANLCIKAYANNVMEVFR